MDPYLSSNQALWNELTTINAKSDFYELAQFKAGGTSLKSIEMNELGSVEGKSLLHLQCHFGMDTLSWGRLGAKVTGVDFSDNAISLARALSIEVGIEAEFIHSNIDDLTK